ncbi:MAG: DUF4256 domain-containing protein [Cyclobacteriaceae bacterium]|nr:DUF4256 domain-containing protein [Cyclobacteriaceae bacterium]
MKKQISADLSRELLSMLEARFDKHKNRHPRLLWSQVNEKLIAQPEKTWSLFEMERTGGEPDVIDLGENNDAIVYFDFQGLSGMLKALMKASFSSIYFLNTDCQNFVYLMYDQLHRH